MLFEKEGDDKLYKRMKTFGIEGQPHKIKSLALSSAEDLLLCALSNSQLFSLNMANTEVMKVSSLPVLLPLRFARAVLWAEQQPAVLAQRGKHKLLERRPLCPSCCCCALPETFLVPLAAVLAQDGQHGGTGHEQLHPDLRKHPASQDSCLSCTS